MYQGLRNSGVDQRQIAGPITRRPEVQILPPLKPKAEFLQKVKSPCPSLGGHGKDLHASGMQTDQPGIIGRAPIPSPEGGPCTPILLPALFKES